MKGVAGEVGLRAVELERQLGLGPGDVDLEAGHAGVELGLRQAVVETEPLEPALRLAAEEVGLGAIGGQDAMEAVAPPAAGHARLDLLQRTEVEDAQLLRAGDRPGEPALVEDVGEVDEGPGDRGDRNRRDKGAVRGGQRAGAVELDARFSACTHVER